MSSFVVEVNDPNGRQGVLDIGGDHVMTPEYVPSDEVYHAMGDIPVGAGWRKSCISEYDLWVQRSDIGRIRLYPEEKAVMEGAACEQMDRLQSSVKMLHFNFFSDIVQLEKETVIDMLRLQYRAGADVIEIPHVFCDAHAYERVVRHALEWQQHTTSETPLMGIARTTADLSMLDHYLPKLGGIGIDCRQFNKPLFCQVRKTLKCRDVWVHAFSAPLQYHEVQNRGTLGMLINWFGVDTVNTTALNDHVRQYFTGILSRMRGQEVADLVKKIRYFAPSDYSTCTFGMMEERYGPEGQLSAFCDCPVCRGLTIGDAVENLQDLYLMNQVHRAFAYCGESQKYRHALIHNTTDPFIDAKPFAAEILRSTAGPHLLNGRCASISGDMCDGGKKRSDRGNVKGGSPGAAPLM